MAGCKPLLSFSRSIVEDITKPLETLTLLIDRLINNELDLSVKPPEPCAEDIRDVYAALEELRFVLMFTSEDVANLGGTRALLAYSAANQLFERRENMKGRAVSLYCISRLHFQSGRYIESAISIHESIQLTRRLEERSQVTQIKHYYKDWTEKRTLQMIKILLVIAEEGDLSVLGDAAALLTNCLSNTDNSYFVKASLYVQLAFAAVLRNNLAEVNDHLLDADRMIAKIDNTDSLLDFRIYTEALYYEAVGEAKKAATLYTQILERSKKLNPRTKANCIKHLYFIFKSKGLTSPQLYEHHAGLNRRKDVVFLMDYSLSMTGPRIARAIKGFLALFDRALVADDRLSFIVFNRFPQVIFDLTCKGRNTAFLRNSIEACKQ